MNFGPLRLVALSILLLLLASCAGQGDPHQIRFSKLPDRSFPSDLEGQTVAARIYPFVSPDKDVTEARFFIDDATRTGAAHSDQKVPPFDMEGGESWAANPYDSRQLHDGKHSVAAVLTLASGRTRTVTASFTVDNTTTINRAIYWGVAIEGVPWDMSKLAAFESTVGKAPSIVQYWLPWSEQDAPAPFNPDLLENVRNHGSIPMISWLPERISQGVDQPNYQLSKIIGGRYDDYLRQWATDAKNWGDPFMLRFAHEMNGFWFPWGESANGNQKGEYVAAWRHVVDIFRTAGATNVTWVWCANIDWSGSGWPTMKELYPGDDYVDWTCLDGYNWGPSQGGWKSLNDVFRWSYENIRSFAPNKPMLLGEFGSSEEGGSKAEWIADTFGFALPHDFPGIHAAVWYNFAAQQDWRIQSSQASIDAFRASIASPYYTSNDFGSLRTSPIIPPR